MPPTCAEHLSLDLRELLQFWGWARLEASRSSSCFYYRLFPTESQCKGCLRWRWVDAAPHHLSCFSWWHTGILARQAREAENAGILDFLIPPDTFNTKIHNQLLLLKKPSCLCLRSRFHAWASGGTALGHRPHLLAGATCFSSLSTHGMSVPRLGRDLSQSNTHYPDSSIHVLTHSTNIW